MRQEVKCVGSHCPFGIRLLDNSFFCPRTSFLTVMQLFFCFLKCLKEGTEVFFLEEQPLKMLNLKV